MLWQTWILDPIVLWACGHKANLVEVEGRSAVTQGIADVEPDEAVRLGIVRLFVS